MHTDAYRFAGWVMYQDENGASVFLRAHSRVGFLFFQQFQTADGCRSVEMSTDS